MSEERRPAKASEPAPRGARATLARVVPPIVIGVLLRAALVLLFPDMVLYGDELHFFQSGNDVASGREATHFPFRPPLYVGFLGLVFWTFGPSADAVRLVQCGLEGLAILGVFLLVRRTLGVRAATYAAWLYAVFPDFVTFSHTLWSETISLVLLVFGTLALVTLSERPSARTAVVGGLLWGALALAKPHHLYLLPLLLGWVVFCAPEPRGPAWRAAGLALAVGILTVVPWSVHQSLEEDRFIVICTTGPKNLVAGVNYAPPPQFDYASRWNLRDAERRSGPQRETSVPAFILENPRLFLRRAWQKMTYLWWPNSYFIRHVYTAMGDGSRSKYGEPNEMVPALRLGAVWLTIGSNIVVTLAFLAGLFLSGERRLTGLAAVYCLAYMGMITLTPSLSRYRLPLMVYGVCFAGAFLASGLDLRRARPAALVGLTTTLLLMLAWWSERLPDLVEAIW